MVVGAASVSRMRLLHSMVIRISCRGTSRGLRLSVRQPLAHHPGASSSRGCSFARIRLAVIEDRGTEDKESHRRFVAFFSGGAAARGGLARAVSAAGVSSWVGSCSFARIRLDGTEGEGTEAKVSYSRFGAVCSKGGPWGHGMGMYGLVRAVDVEGGGS